jgi:hypothetical protein
MWWVTYVFIKISVYHVQTVLIVIHFWFTDCYILYGTYIYHIWTAYLLVHSNLAPSMLCEACIPFHVVMVLLKRLIPKIVIIHYIGGYRSCCEIGAALYDYVFTQRGIRVLCMLPEFGWRYVGATVKVNVTVDKLMFCARYILVLRSILWMFCNPAFIFYWEGVLRMMWCYLQCPIKTTGYLHKCN